MSLAHRCKLSLLSAVFLEVCALGLAGATAGCSAGSSITGGTGGTAEESRKVQKNGSSKKLGSNDEEDAEADMPAEISGGFLTCAHVSVEDGGFGASSEYKPVGCVVNKNGVKVVPTNFDLELGLFTETGEELAMKTRQAPASAPWHAFGHLNRKGSRDKLLGMRAIYHDTKKRSQPLFFEVKDLQANPGDEDLISFNLASGYKPSKLYSLQGPGAGRGEPAPDTAMGLNNVDTPFLPVAHCNNGKVRPEVDLNQYEGSGETIGRVLGQAIDATGIMDKKIAPTVAFLDGITPNQVSCFVMAKEAAPDNYNRVVKQAPLIRGAGCLFAQSKNGILVYSAQDLLEYEVNPDDLERYVKAHMCKP